MNEQRSLRIKHELQLLQSVADQHDWVTMTLNAADPIPGRETIIVEIRGRGLACGGPGARQYETCDHHRIVIGFPDDYPRRSPMIEITSPVFHPNIAANGRIALPDIGMSWQTDLTVDIVIERIWDLIRVATMDIDNAINGAAARWLSGQSVIELPLDPRGLSSARSMSNIVRYRPKDRSRPVANARTRDLPHVIDDCCPAAKTDTGVHFIE